MIYIFLPFCFESIFVIEFKVSLLYMAYNLVIFFPPFCQSLFHWVFKLFMLKAIIDMLPLKSVILLLISICFFCFFFFCSFYCLSKLLNTSFVCFWIYLWLFSLLVPLVKWYTYLIYYTYWYQHLEKVWKLHFYLGTFTVSAYKYHCHEHHLVLKFCPIIKYDL